MIKNIRRIFDLSFSFKCLVSLINSIIKGICGISFQDILGYIFSSFVFLMGVPFNEAVKAGSIMAMKLVSNEFVAMITLSQRNLGLSYRAIAIVSVFLV